MHKNLQTRFRKREEQRILLLNRARDNFAQIVKIIIEKYHPKRIYQWGSLIDGSHFTERSDIDIATIARPVISALMAPMSTVLN